MQPAKTVVLHGVLFRSGCELTASTDLRRPLHRKGIQEITNGLPQLRPQCCGVLAQDICWILPSASAGYPFLRKAHCGHCVRPRLKALAAAVEWGQIRNPSLTAATDVSGERPAVSRYRPTGSDLEKDDQRVTWGPKRPQAGLQAFLHKIDMSLCGAHWSYTWGSNVIRDLGLYRSSSRLTSHQTERERDSKASPRGE